MHIALVKNAVGNRKGQTENCLLEKFYTHTNMHMYTHTYTYTPTHPPTIKKVKEL